MMTVPAPHRIVVSIFEEGKDYPAVVHIFYGRLIQEAYRYLQAHMRTDKFLHACVIDKKFGEMACRSEQHTQHWNGRRWVDG
jgi:Lhr-like helicase